MQTRHFRLAKSIALRSDHRVKIGAVLVNKGQVLNVGHNRVGKTHPKYPWYLHAEMDSCLGIHRADLTGSTVYLFRANRLGTVLNCRPCGTCQTLLKELGIRAVYYTTGNVVYKFPLPIVPMFTEGQYVREPEILMEPHYMEIKL